MSCAVESPAGWPGPAAGDAGPPTLTGLFRRHGPAILRAYALFAVENLAGLAQPLALGLAIRGLAERSWQGLALLGAQ
jgi:hypothetical protein